MRVSSSSSLVWITFSAMPFLTDWRRRDASNGCSWRWVEPTISTDLAASSSTMLEPSHSAPCCAAATRLSLRRSAASILLTPKLRASFCARYSSSVVLCGLAKKPMASLP
ncbi:hypothetical protein D3C85_1320770 [compost metagenome]